MKLTEIIKLIGGELINNDEIIEIKNIKPLSNAEENDISFIFDKTPTTINSKAKCVQLLSTGQYAASVKPPALGRIT